MSEPSEMEGMETGTGSRLEPNVAGALSYLFAPLGGVVMYVLNDDDEFVRFHALQGIAFGVAVIAVWLGMFAFNFVLNFLLGDVPFVGLLAGLVSLLLTPVVGLALFAAWAFLTYKAYQGERVRIPVLGSFASR
ncbi:MAG: hypothetical protein V5A28_03210 [Haloarculaceae archaeon]